MLLLPIDSVAVSISDPTFLSLVLPPLQKEPTKIGFAQSCARIQLDELVDGLRRGVAVLEHPKEVLEQHHLAAYDDGGARVGGGATGEDLEEAVLDKVGADEVPSAGLADVDGVENGRGAAVTVASGDVDEDPTAGASACATVNAPASMDTDPRKRQVTSLNQVHLHQSSSRTLIT
ncbi:hypothetical protein ZIOFF_004068 [Zingiber officinale]|uniref:Uncharacterized protein n=1 Tax=Zingiber officinale TaxID=94328 RepID=A0A8J5HYJ4_ZINOF|nr:hypothetical protein ZIOFF_004068 [Zingiber officinale]